MSSMTEMKLVEEMTDEQWLAIRKEAGLMIQPDSAEVDWRYGAIFDPYEIGLDLPEEMRVAGRIYFARSPGSDIWVEFGDLPEAIREALWHKHRQVLAFPAGLPSEFFKS
jgi:hypothetical protein